MAKRTADVVKTGGVANDEADIEDVTRDTYGFSKTTGVRPNRDQRLAEADRAASAAGVPGVDLPKPSSANRASTGRDEKLIGATRLPRKGDDTETD